MLEPLNVEVLKEIDEIVESVHYTFLDLQPIMKIWKTT